MNAPRGLAIYIAVVQFFFATTWTVYAIYLPQLAAQAGLPKGWVPWILLADQVVFAITDVAVGFWTDRVRAGLARMGGWILAASVVSGAAFLVLPFASTSAVTLVVPLVIWALTSAALRSPPWVLLSRYAAAPAVPGLSALVLVGSGLAAAAAPYLGVALRNIDPRWPFVLSSLTLLATVAGLVVAERRVAGATPGLPAGESASPYRWDAPQARSTAFVVYFALLLLAAGYQVHFSLNSAPLYLRFVQASELTYLMPLFWVGFNLLMFPASKLVKRAGAVPVMLGAAVAGATATALAAHAGSLEILGAVQFAAGGCWAAAIVAAYTAATSMGRVGREGAVLGSLFSVLACATLARVAIVATGAQLVPGIAPLMTWLPTAIWALAGLLLLLAGRKPSRARQNA